MKFLFNCCKETVQCITGTLYLISLFRFFFYPGHLIECDKKSEIVRYFQGRLCEKIGLLCNKLCDFVRANLHFFTKFQRRKTTLMLFNGQFECKGIIKHLF